MSDNECVNCHRPVGEKAKVIPVHVADEGDDHEPWCPRCFVWHRAPLEPLRYDPACYTAVKCGKCGNETLCIHHENVCCAQCRSRIITVLPPVPKDAA